MVSLLLFLHQFDFRAFVSVTKLHVTGSQKADDACHVTEFRLLYTNDSRWWTEYASDAGVRAVSDESRQ